MFIYESFQYSETITFGGKMWYPPPLSKNSFPISELFSNTDGILYDLFAKKRHKNSKKKAVITPNMEKVFRYRSCSQTLNGHLLSFLVLWDKIFPSEKCDFLLLCRKFIEIGVFLKQWRVPPRIFSVLRDKVVPAEKLHISLVGVNLFDTWKILKHTNVHLRKFSTLRDYNFTAQNCDTLPPSP